MAPSTAPGPTGRVRAATPTDVSAAIAARRARERRRHLLVVSILGAIALLLAGLVYLVGYSSVLASSRVVVSGNSLVTTDEVLQAANVPLGVPLARLDTEPVADRVATLAPVDEVRVSTRWPNQVRIVVRERVGVFQRQQGSRWQVVDADGVVFRTLPKQQSGLPVATSKGIETELLADVATVVGSLTPALRAQLAQVRCAGSDEIEVVLKGGQRIIWGGADQSTTKAQVAQALVGQGKFTLINVTSPAYPTSR